MSLGHFDGTNTAEGINAMILSINHLEPSSSWKSRESVNSVTFIFSYLLCRLIKFIVFCYCLGGSQQFTVHIVL